MLVQEGAKVTRGQILARLDTSRLRPEAATAEAVRGLARSGRGSQRCDGEFAGRSGAQLRRIARWSTAQPGELVAELSPVASVPPVPPHVPIGLPSDLLRRRPDVRRAERQLAAETARKSGVVHSQQISPS
ncbi:MAG: hypothetical protein ACLPTF_23105 [Steroidobacteraceae bacterium]